MSPYWLKIFFPFLKFMGILIVATQKVSYIISVQLVQDKISTGIFAKISISTEYNTAPPVCVRSY